MKVETFEWIEIENLKEDSLFEIDGKEKSWWMENWNPVTLSGKTTTQFDREDIQPLDRLMELLQLMQYRKNYDLNKKTLPENQRWSIQMSETS